MNRIRLLLVSFALLSVPSFAQAATVVFDVPAATVVDLNGWTSTLYVNGTAFPLTHTCILTGAIVTCTAPLPNVASALVAGTAQTFEVDLFDPVLNVRSPKSASFIRNRPAAPTSGRFQ